VFVADVLLELPPEQEVNIAVPASTAEIRNCFIFYFI